MSSMGVGDWGGQSLGEEIAIQDGNTVEDDYSGWSSQSESTISTQCSTDSEVDETIHTLQLCTMNNNFLSEEKITRQENSHTAIPSSPQAPSTLCTGTYVTIALEASQ